MSSIFCGRSTSSKAPVDKASVGVTGALEIIAAKKKKASEKKAKKAEAEAEAKAKATGLHIELIGDDEDDPNLDDDGVVLTDALCKSMDHTGKFEMGPHVMEKAIVENGEEEDGGKPAPGGPITLRWYGYDEPFDPALGLTKKEHEAEIKERLESSNKASGIIDPLVTLRKTFEEADWIGSPRVHAQCPLPADRVRDMPTFKPLTVTVHYNSKDTHREHMEKIKLQTEYATAKNTLTSFVKFEDGITSGLFLGGGNFLERVYMGKSLSPNDTAHAVLLHAAVVKSSNSMGEELEVLNMFPVESSKDVAVFLGTSTTNQVVSFTESRSVYRSVPAGTYDAGTGDGLTLFSLDKSDPAQLKNLCSPEAFRWRQLCEKDFQDAIDAEHHGLSTKRSRGPESAKYDCVMIAATDSNLLSFLVMSYAHDIRSLYAAYNFPEADLAFTAYEDEDLKASGDSSSSDDDDDVDDDSPAQHKIPNVIYVRTSVIMAVVRYYLARFHGVAGSAAVPGGAMAGINLRRSYVLVKPVASPWKSFVRPNDSELVPIHVEVKYTFLVMPSHCPVANPDAFSAGLLELGLVLKNTDILVDARTGVLLDASNGVPI
jgi:hypothetical protein